MAVRFQTYFGIPIPPFKEDLMGAGSIPIRFVIKGRIPSKKNNEMAVAVKKKAKEHLKRIKQEKGSITYRDAFDAIDLVYGKVVGNKQYASFLEQMRPIMEEQKKFWLDRLANKGLSFPLYKSSMSLRLYFKDKYVTDTVNKQQSIQDLLIDCGVIANDDYVRLNPIHSASACYKDELVYNIAFITLSFRF